MNGRSPWAPPADLGAVEKRALLAGGAALALSLVGAWLDFDRFLQSYLVAWLLWVGVALGCLALLALHHLTRGAWGLVVRRVLEAAAQTLPLLGLLFVPVLLRLPTLYSWARPEAADDKLLVAKAAYLNEPGFIIRAALFFLLWSGVALLLARASRRQDEARDADESRRLFRRMQVISGPALGVYALTATFASVDWIMSLDPHWYSSLFGVYYIGGHGVSALAFVVIAALWLHRREPMSKVLQPRHFHDYGKLLMAFVMLWAYFAISQLLIIWSGNLAEETTWYLERVEGGWKFVTIGLALFHFVLPFLLLLSRNLKRSARRVAVVAALLLVMRWFDLYWQVVPVFHHGLSPHWLDLTLPIGLGGIWLAFFVRLLSRRPLLPENDPFLDEALGRA